MTFQEINPDCLNWLAFSVLFCILKKLFNGHNSEVRSVWGILSCNNISWRLACQNGITDLHFPFMHCHGNTRLTNELWSFCLWKKAITSADISTTPPSLLHKSRCFWRTILFSVLYPKKKWKHVISSIIKKIIIPVQSH